MTLQAQAMQRGEKFKESEVRPKVEATLERGMVSSPALMPAYSMSIGGAW